MGHQGSERACQKWIPDDENGIVEGSPLKGMWLQSPLPRSSQLPWGGQALSATHCRHHVLWHHKPKQWGHLTRNWKVRNRELRQTFLPLKVHYLGYFVTAAEPSLAHQVLSKLKVTPRSLRSHSHFSQTKNFCDGLDMLLFHLVYFSFDPKHC